MTSYTVSRIRILINLNIYRTFWLAKTTLRAGWLYLELIKGNLIKHRKDSPKRTYKPTERSGDKYARDNKNSKNKNFNCKKKTKSNFVMVDEAIFEEYLPQEFLQGKAYKTMAQGLCKE